MINNIQKAHIRFIGFTHLILGILILSGFSLYIYERWGRMEYSWDSIAFMASISIILIMFLMSGVGILANKRWAMPYIRVCGAILFVFVRPWGRATLNIHKMLEERIRQRKRSGYN